VTAFPTLNTTSEPGVPAVGAITRQYRRGPLQLCCALLVGLAACSSPYNFSREVGAFGTGVAQLSDGFNSGYAALAADRAALAQLQLTGNRAKVAIAKSCFAIPRQSSQNEVPCELYRSGGSPPARSEIEQARNKTTVLLAALKDYAQALVAVTNAADRAAYDAAVGQLASAVGAIASNAGPQGAAIGTVAPAAVNLTGWVVGAALDQQRFDSLKAGVDAVGRPLPDGKTIAIDAVAREAGAGLFALALAQREVLVNELNTLTHSLGPSLTDAAYRQRLNDAQAIAAVLDRLRLTDPTATANALINAHRALVAAVDDPGRDYSSLVTAVNDFADQAAALHAALSATPTAKSTTGR
jgi:hypothetical protein